MKNSLNTLIGGLCLLMLFSSMPAVSEITAMGDAINQAGRQRMLTQRIVKAYAMIGQDIDALKAEKQLHDAVALFERQLADLKRFAPSSQISADLEQVELRWKPFKAAATAAPDKEQAVKVRELGNKTLAAAHQAVLSLQAASGSAAGHLVNIAGRQRMLSQRLAGLYLFKAWGIEDDAVQTDYAKATEQFSAAQQELSAAPENTAAISKELKTVGAHWRMYQRSGALRDGDYIPLLIVRSSEKILKMMNDVTGRYAAIADKMAE